MTGALAAEPGWVRVDDGDGHPRWEIKNPHGDGRNFLVTDFLIKTYGRAHVERVCLHDLPPLPDEAWLLVSKCPDGGTCHHECGGGACFRVLYCGPLSGVYPGNEWPLKVYQTERDKT